jgi:hypothetical protein
MATHEKPHKMTFKSVSQDELPNGRKGKHHTIVLQLLQDIEQMDEERALKIPTAEPRFTSLLPQWFHKHTIAGGISVGDSVANKAFVLCQLRPDYQ